MSHVDEGALHAYLDGALDEYPLAEARRIREHVETCAVCSERLSVERNVREEAHGILGLAAPEVVVPTFEELRAYVRASRPERSVTSVRLYRMSWAASIVLALGTGWMLRGGQAVPIRPFERSGSADGVPLRAVDQRPAESVTAREVEAPTVGTSSAEALSVEERGVDVDGFRSPGNESVVGLARRSSVPTSAPRNEVVGSVPSEPVPAAGPLIETRDFSDVLVTSASPSGAQGAGAAVPVPAAQPVHNRVAERIDSAARATQPERRVAAQDQVVASAISSDAAATVRQRSANDRADADEEDEGSSLVVPGLEVLAVLPVGDGTTFAGMRALQRLESGDTLELVHLPRGVDPSLLPTLRTGYSALVLPRGEGWLVMRAPVSEPYLQELLQRLEGER